MKAVVFDLDGTLIDSAPDLHGASAKMLEQESCPPLDLATITSFIGNGVPKLVERVARASGLDEFPENLQRLTENFLTHYDAAPADLTVVYPGVISVLRSLRDRGFGLGVCTNKPEAPTRAILDAFDLTDYFSTIIGGDSLRVRKPDPEPLCRAFENLKASERLYVGDSETDAATAVHAEVPFALFTEGYRKSPVFEIPHAYAFDRFSDLPEIIEFAFTEAA